MFTVVRIAAPIQSRELVAERVAVLNSLAPDSLFESRRRGDGFAASVSRRSNWESHAREIEEYLQRVGDELHMLTAAGIAVTFDVAVDPQDLRSLVTTFRFAPRLIELFWRSGASFEVSYYEGE